MYIGKTYQLSEFLLWTRRNIFWLIIAGTIPTVLYQVFDCKWLAIPWSAIALLGTATVFLVGFKNLQTYNRTWEARQIWGGCMSSSRAWAAMCNDFLNDREQSKQLIYRHFAWLTALRYQMRAMKGWETTSKSYNKEYRQFFSIPERETPLEEELGKYISTEELKYVLNTSNIAAQLLNFQSNAIRKLYAAGYLDALRFSDMHKAIREFFDHQGKCERIKNFPYPRQYATINSFFVKLFCFLLPFGMLREFNSLNGGMTGFLEGKMVWFVIPISVLISWVYTSLEQVGESTENPFEGNANDVPISQMSRAVEIDIREMLGENELPDVLHPKNNIIL